MDEEHRIALCPRVRSCRMTKAAGPMSSPRVGLTRRREVFREDLARPHRTTSAAHRPPIWPVRVPEPPFAGSPPEPLPAVSSTLLQRMSSNSTSAAGACWSPPAASPAATSKRWFWHANWPDRRTMPRGRCSVRSRRVLSENLSSSRSTPRAVSTWAPRPASCGSFSTRGRGALRCSSSIATLMSCWRLSDRIVVLFRGRLAECPAVQATKEEIGRRMMGVGFAEEAGQPSNAGVPRGSQQ